MAANIKDYEKLFLVLKNKPNTMWLSRSPDKTFHVLTVRPRYVEERLGKVNLTGTADKAGNIVTEFNKPDLDIGFEVTNQAPGWVVVDMFHEGRRVANIALKSGETYFFDNRNDIDKRRFSLKKKTVGGSNILFAESSPDENNIYRFVVKHVKTDEWPSKLELNFDDEIKVPYEEKRPNYYPTPLSIPTLYPELESAASKGVMRRSAVAQSLMPPSSSPRPAYVAEQQLGNVNTEKLGTVRLNLDNENTVEFSFVTVLKDF